MARGTLLHEPKFHYRSHKSFDSAYVQRSLNQIISKNETPPPSMAEVARQLGYDQSNLSERFPELCRAISSRYRSHRKTQRAAQVQAWLDEIRAVIHTLYTQGVYPSYKQIRAYLSYPDCMRLAEARVVRRETMVGLGLVEPKD